MEDKEFYKFIDDVCESLHDHFGITVGESGWHFKANYENTGKAKVSIMRCPGIRKVGAQEHRRIEHEAEKFLVERFAGQPVEVDRWDSVWI